MLKNIIEWATLLRTDLPQFRKRLKVAVQILRSFLPWRQVRKQPRKGSLAIEAQRQWTSYSCTAAVAQMVARYYGIRLGHRKAIKLTRCKPNGASLDCIARGLKREYGLRPRTLRGRAGIRSSLAQRRPVITHDALSYSSDHAILVVGATQHGFWIADPAVCEIYWRHERRFFAGAEEFISVAGPN